LLYIGAHEILDPATVADDLHQFEPCARHAQATIYKDDEFGVQRHEQSILLDHIRVFVDADYLSAPMSQHRHSDDQAQVDEPILRQASEWWHVHCDI